MSFSEMINISVNSIKTGFSKWSLRHQISEIDCQIDQMQYEINELRRSLRALQRERIITNSILDDMK